MRKHILNTKIICGVCLALSAMGVFFWFWFRKALSNDTGYIDNTISIFSILITIVSVGLILYELIQTKKLQEAEFIILLNQAFVDNQAYAEMYSELERSYIKNKKTHLTRIEISNYITFFETIYLLLESGAVNIRTLDDLFEYRFFLAVHNKTVQKLKLVESPYNFRNIYYLEDIWMEYRRNKGLPIFGEKDTLYLACKRAGKEQVYISIMNDRERKKRK